MPVQNYIAAGAIVLIIIIVAIRLIQRNQEIESAKRLRVGDLAYYKHPEFRWWLVAKVKEILPDGRLLITIDFGDYVEKRITNVYRVKPKKQEKLYIRCQ